MRLAHSATRRRGRCMKQLSGLDASFLYMETPEMPMHVGGLNVFELPAGYKGSFVGDLRRHLAARLPLAPPMRQEVAWMPFNLGNPVWIDAMPDFDAPVVLVKLPKGSGMDALHAKIGELHPKLLDRDRPLWKFHVFEGLAPGPNKEKRVALYTKVHHAAVDGQAAVALAAAIFDVSEQPRNIERQPQPEKKLQIGMAEMLSRVFANQLQQYVNLVKNLPSTVGALTDVAKQGGSAAVAKVRGRGKAAEEESVSLGLAPRPRLN